MARPTTDASATAQRLIAHARLCQQIAERAWSGALAAELKDLADECLRAAAAIERPETHTLH